MPAHLGLAAKMVTVAVFKRIFLFSEPKKAVKVSTKTAPFCCVQRESGAKGE